MNTTEALQNFVSAIDAYQETGVWPDNYTLLALADCGREALKNAPADLAALIGQPPAGSHPDEWQPRSKTWHEERLAWAGEVEQLRAYIKKLEATGIDGALDEISQLRADNARLKATASETKTLPSPPDQ